MELTLTLFEPFSKHLYHESKVGNLIDSALVVTDGSGLTALNANDNTPDLDACRMLKDRYGKIDLAMINYNAAGAYPSCFQNLADDEKRNEHERILERNIDHLIHCCDTLLPRAILPFAGAYVIGGKQWKKNQYLGTTTWDDCARRIREASKHCAVTMRENDELDLRTLTLNRPYTPINESEQQSYIEDTLSKISYPHEQEKHPSAEALDNAIKESIERLQERANRYQISVKSKIKVTIGEDMHWIVNKGDEEYGVHLEFIIDSRLLIRILERRAHWNNAEIGCHIDIYRQPNTYEPDAHTLMQFLHL